MEITMLARYLQYGGRIMNVVGAVQMDAPEDGKYVDRLSP